MQGTNRLPEILRKHEGEILAEWRRQQGAPGGKATIKEPELHEQSRRFLAVLREAAQESFSPPFEGPHWDRTREWLTQISRERARVGETATGTAMFILSLKLPVFARLREEYGGDAQGLAAEISNVSLLLDRLGLHTVEVFVRSREEVIARQQEEMLELSTPVVKLWDGILALPLIGTLDSARTQVVMETLLQQIVNTGAGIAIIDITGVPTVDTLVAQHLLRTVAAARLMGADCIISGIRPQIAQTIVHLGVALGDVVTKATLADAFDLALMKTGSMVVRREREA